MPQRVDCGVIIFTKKILKGKNLSLSSGFSDKFLTDISLGGAKEHLCNFTDIWIHYCTQQNCWETARIEK